MHFAVIAGDDINSIYRDGMEMLAKHGVREDSRNGPVVVMPFPVTTVYTDPLRRVLFDGRRNANPFFHVYEALWMLSGRDDVASLNTYIGDFGARYAEKDGTVHGAYGHRWRKHFGFDQLSRIVDRLRANPQDRQAVLQMWDASDWRLPEDPDARWGSNDLLGDWKDRPCNTQVYFRVNQRALDMTVTCRSNDVVFGAYGANVVHFSFLLEYMASMIGVDIGNMYQFSNNYHGYLDVLDRVGMPGDVENYVDRNVTPTEMVDSAPLFDADLDVFMQWADKRDPRVDVAYPSNPWFEFTATPMLKSWWLWKSGMKREAMQTAQDIEAEDWRLACVQWFMRRKKVTG